MKFLCLVFTLLCALSAFAATSKSVSYKSGDDTVQALIYTPEGKAFDTQHSAFSIQHSAMHSLFLLQASPMAKC
jgi:membrane-associated PAP2 superfamily phosphatase